MKRITITLTDEEYAALEQRAQGDRRSIRDMAARLVTQPEVNYIRADWTWHPQPWINPYPTNIGSGSVVAEPCYACRTPGTTASHTCLWAGNSTVMATTTTGRTN